MFENVEIEVEEILNWDKVILECVFMKNLVELDEVEKKIKFLEEKYDYYFIYFSFLEDFVDMENSCEDCGVVDYSDKKWRILDCGLRFKIVFFDL